jgi:hypothetical protein
MEIPASRLGSASLQSQSPAVTGDRWDTFTARYAERLEPRTTSGERVDHRHRQSDSA